MIQSAEVELTKKKKKDIVKGVGCVCFRKTAVVSYE